MSRAEFLVKKKLFLTSAGVLIFFPAEVCVQYVAQFPATLVCNRPNFLFMHGNFLIFLQDRVYLLTFKMYGDRLPTSSTKEIMPLFAKLVSCPVSGQRVQFPAINRKQKFHSIRSDIQGYLDVAQRPYFMGLLRGVW